MSDLASGIEQILATGRSKPRTGRDPVNQPMIRHWVDAIGDDNPIYVDEAAARAAGHPGIVAPPAKIQVWTMMGLGATRPDDDPLGIGPLPVEPETVDTPAPVPAPVPAQQPTPTGAEARRA